MMQLGDPFMPGISLDAADQSKADAFVKMLRSAHCEARETHVVRHGRDILLCNNYMRSPYVMQHHATVTNKTEV